MPQEKNGTSMFTTNMSVLVKIHFIYVASFPQNYPFIFFSKLKKNTCFPFVKRILELKKFLAHHLLYTFCCPL